MSPAQGHRVQTLTHFRGKCGVPSIWNLFLKASLLRIISFGEHGGAPHGDARIHFQQAAWERPFFSAHSESRYADLTHSQSFGDFPTLGVVLAGPMIRTLVFWGLYWGPPILGKYDFESNATRLTRATPGLTSHMQSWQATPTRSAKRSCLYDLSYMLEVIGPWMQQEAFSFYFMAMTRWEVPESEIASKNSVPQALWMYRGSKREL